MILLSPPFFWNIRRTSDIYCSHDRRQSALRLRYASPPSIPRSLFKSVKSKNVCHLQSTLILLACNGQRKTPKRYNTAMDQTIHASNAVSKKQAFRSKTERPEQKRPAVCETKLDIGRVWHLKHLEESTRIPKTKNTNTCSLDTGASFSVKAHFSATVKQSFEYKQKSNSGDASMSHSPNTRQPRNALSHRPRPLPPQPGHMNLAGRERLPSHAVQASSATQRYDCLCREQSPPHVSTYPTGARGRASCLRPVRCANSQLYKSWVESVEQMLRAGPRISGVQPQPRVGAQLVDGRPLAWFVQEARLN